MSSEEESKLAETLAESVISDATGTVTEVPSEAIGDAGDKEPKANTASEEDIVDPWNVTSASSAGIDYDKLIGK